MIFLNFTTQEIKALLLLLIALLVGSGITLYKKTHPQFAPELVLEKADLTPLGNLQTTIPSPTRQIPQRSDHPLKRVRVNINQATTSELETVPGLGPALSQRIVQYRKVKGPFLKLEDLVKVRGIGSNNLEKIRDYLTVE